MGAVFSKVNEFLAPDKVVLPSNLSGGPHGLGDPNDKSLRHVEKDIVIPKIMKERAKKEKCLDVHDAFGICSKENGLMMPFKCRKESNALKGCLLEAFKDPEFVESCTQEYLKKREEYRATGLTKERIQNMKNSEERIQELVEELREKDRKAAEARQQTL